MERKKLRHQSYPRMRNRKVETPLRKGEKLVKAKCIGCNDSYFEVLKKGKKKEPWTFICEECKQRIKRIDREYRKKRPQKRRSGKKK